MIIFTYYHWVDFSNFIKNFTFYHIWFFFKIRSFLQNWNPLFIHFRILVYIINSFFYSLWIYFLIIFIFRFSFNFIFINISHSFAILINWFLSSTIKIDHAISLFFLFYWSQCFCKSVCKLTFSMGWGFFFLFEFSWMFNF